MLKVLHRSDKRLQRKPFLMQKYIDIDKHTDRQTDRETGAFQYSRITFRARLRPKSHLLYGEDTAALCPLN